MSAISSTIVNDELSFMEYAERIIYEMQRLFRTKPVLECYPVIGIKRKYY